MTYMKNINIWIVVLFVLITIHSNSFSQDTCWDKAVNLANVEKPKDALEVLLKCKCEKDSRYYHFTGYCYEMIYDKAKKKKYYKSALKNYKKCIETDKNNYYANLFLGYDNFNNKKYKEAVNDFQKALSDSATFKKCSFFPKYLYGDIAIAYSQMDSLIKANEYFLKIMGDTSLILHQPYLNHWLDFSLRSDYVSDTALYKIINTSFLKVNFPINEDSLETISILYFLSLRLQYKYPDWYWNYTKDSRVDALLDFVEMEMESDKNKFMKFAKTNSYHFPYFVFMFSNYKIISGKEYYRFIKKTYYEKVFSFYTPE